MLFNKIIMKFTDFKNDTICMLFLVHILVYFSTCKQDLLIFYYILSIYSCICPISLHLRLLKIKFEYVHIFRSFLLELFNIFEKVVFSNIIFNLICYCSNLVRQSIQLFMHLIRFSICKLNTFNGLFFAI